jgi:hypothetical protein
VNVQPLIVPVELTVHVLTDPSDPPALIENEMVTPGVNPLPEAVTVVPLGPLSGLSVSVGVVTWKLALEASKLPSDPTAVMA